MSQNSFSLTCRDIAIVTAESHAAPGHRGCIRLGGCGEEQQGEPKLRFAHIPRATVDTAAACHQQDLGGALVLGLGRVRCLVLADRRLHPRPQVPIIPSTLTTVLSMFLYSIHKCVFSIERWVGEPGPALGLSMGSIERRLVRILSSE